MATNNIEKHLVFTIEYKIEPQYADMERILEHMREQGDARIVDVRVEGTVKDKQNGTR